MSKKWLGVVTNCDICGQPFTDVFIDGRTITGQWGLMCPSCHEVHGVGLGAGKGQKYNAVTKEAIR